MNASARAVLMTIAGVFAAGLILRFGGNLPLLDDVRRGLNGQKK